MSAEAVLPPDRPWALRQVWHDLLFAHWGVAPAKLRPLVPRELEIETCDGEAWVGVVPFRMTAVRLRRWPPLPGASSFPELNVRTYVRRGDVRGVWFFSLDASSWLAVRAARAWFRLPYFHARMRCEEDAAGGGLGREGIVYSSERAHPGAPSARLEARYRPLSPPGRSAPGSLDHFLTERYELFAVDRRGGLLRAAVRHEPWALQRAEAEISANTMALAAGIELPLRPPLLHFARRREVAIWSPERSHGA